MSTISILATVVSAALLCLPAPAQEAAARVAVLAGGGGGQQVRPDVRDQFLRIERIARLGADEQKSQLPALYREAAPALMSVVVEGMVSSMPAHLFERDRQFIHSSDDIQAYADQLDSKVPTLTPEAAADLIGAAHGEIILRVAARRRAMQVLAKHKDDLAKLINDDLSSNDPASARAPSA